jgi:hypothetical protein
MDNLPWPPLSAAQLLAEVAGPAEGAFPWAEPAHSGYTVAAAVGTPAPGWRGNWPPFDVEASEAVAPQRMRRGKKLREDQARMKISS